MYIINEKIEDVLDEGSVADRIIKQIYDLKPDTEIREHSAKEKGFCDCQKEEVEDSNLKQALEEQRESIKKDLVDEIEKYVFNLYDSIHKETGAYKYDWVVEAMEKAILQIINEKMK